MKATEAEHQASGTNTKGSNSESLGFKIGYGLLFGFIYLLSLLPFWILYRLSDIIYLFIGPAFGYRKKVITQNLSLSFPEKSEKEISRIRKGFYRHFCDLFVETLKLASISDRQLEKRAKLLTPNVFPWVEEYGSGTIMLATHYGNFEWTNACISHVSGSVGTYSIYQRLKNPYFEKLMTFLRTRWGTVMVEKSEAFRASLRYLKEGGMIGFMGDQSPSRRKSLHFSPLFGRPTAMHEGAGMLAVGRNVPSFFADIRKVKRGHYTIAMVPVPIETFVAEKDVHGYTDAYAQMLEAAIREAPEYWLWSHKRWKHTPREGDSLSPKLTPEAVESHE